MLLKTVRTRSFVSMHPIKPSRTLTRGLLKRQTKFREIKNGIKPREIRAHYMQCDVLHLNSLSGYSELESYEYCTLYTVKGLLDIFHIMWNSMKYVTACSLNNVAVLTSSHFNLLSAHLSAWNYIKIGLETPNHNSFMFHIIKIALIKKVHQNNKKEYYHTYRTCQKFGNAWLNCLCS